MPEPIDLVYPLGPGSRDGNFEILHSVRLVQKYMTGYRRIYVIGECPTEWLYPPPPQLKHIPAGNEGHNRQDAIRRKLIIACNHPEISDPFLAMNDDYFLRGPLQANTYPYYYNSNLAVAYNSKRKAGHYKRAIMNTILALVNANCPTLYYDIHVPIRYYKKKFLSIMGSFDWSARDGYVIKSLYGNCIEADNPYTNGAATPMPDSNINHFTTTFAEIESFIIPQDRNIFAVGENGLNDNMKNYIKSLL